MSACFVPAAFFGGILLLIILYHLVRGVAPFVRDFFRSIEMKRIRPFKVVTLIPQPVYTVISVAAAILLFVFIGFNVGVKPCHEEQTALVNQANTEHSLLAEVSETVVEILDCGCGE